MNLLLLLALAVPLSCLAFLSFLALLGVATLGAVIHLLSAIRARWPQIAGLRRTAARVTRGAICLSSSSHFPLKLYSKFMKR
jgi:hypothetical protein